jgi:hypothetical protein
MAMIRITSPPSAQIPEESENLFRYEHMTCVKFSIHNEIEWHYSVRQILQYTNTLRLVTGEEEPPVRFIPTERGQKLVEEYDERARLATSLLLGSMSDGELYLLQGLDGPTAIWNVLQKRVENAKCLAYQMDHFMKFDNNTWLPDDTLDTYISRFQRLRFMLSERNLDISETVMILKIIIHLPSEWRPAVQSVRIHGVETVGKLVTILKGYEDTILPHQERKEQDRSPRLTMNGSKGLLDKTLNGPSFKKPNQKRPIPNTSNTSNTSNNCDFCGKRGHIVNNCHHWKKATRPQPSRH